MRESASVVLFFEGGGGGGGGLLHVSTNFILCYFGLS